MKLLKTTNKIYKKLGLLYFKDFIGLIKNEK